MEYFVERWKRTTCNHWGWFISSWPFIIQYYFAFSLFPYLVRQDHHLSIFIYKHIPLTHFHLSKIQSDFYIHRQCHLTNAYTHLHIYKYIYINTYIYTHTKGYKQSSCIDHSNSLFLLKLCYHLAKTRTPKRRYWIEPSIMVNKLLRFTIQS